MEDSFTVTDQVYESGESFAIIDSKLPYSNDVRERKSESQSVESGEESSDTETEGEGQTILGSNSSSQQGTDSPPVSPTLSVDPDELTVSDLAELSSLDEDLKTALPVDFGATRVLSPQTKKPLSKQGSSLEGRALARMNNTKPSIARVNDPFASWGRESTLNGKNPTPEKTHWLRSVVLRVSGGLVLVVALWCLLGTPPLQRRKTAPTLVPVSPMQPTVAFPSPNVEVSLVDIDGATPSHVEVMASDEMDGEEVQDRKEDTVEYEVDEPQEETNKKMTRLAALNMPKRLKPMSWAHMSPPNNFNFNPLVMDLLGWRGIVDWVFAAWRVLSFVVLGLLSVSMLRLIVAMCARVKRRNKRSDHYGQASKTETIFTPKKEKGVDTTASCKDICSILEHCHNSLRRNGRRSSLYVDRYGVNVSAYDRLSKRDLQEICIQLGAKELYAQHHSKPQIIDRVVERYEAILMGLKIPEIKTVLSTKSVQYNQKMNKRHLVELALEAAF